MSSDSIFRKGGHARKKGGSSGEHPIMQAVRKKLDSIREGTMPELEALNARIDKQFDKIKSEPPAEPEECPDTEPEAQRT